MTKLLGRLILKCIPTYLLRDKINKMYENEWKNLKLQFMAIGDKAKVSDPYYIMNPQYMSIGQNFISMHNLRMEAFNEYEGQKFKPELIIGDNVIMNTDCHIGCINKVVIGNDVLMASRIYISDHSHGLADKDSIKLVPIKRPLVSRGPVFIEDNVWIGEGVCVMPGVTIGKNSIIGANAVVTKNVPPNCVAAGIPAKVIKYLEA